MMRKNIVAGNWKMHKNAVDTKKFFSELKEQLPSNINTDIIIAPSFTNLTNASEAVKNTGIKISAQNMHQADGGAFTGEVSAKMLKSIDINTVILGHSERRLYFNEDNALLANKVDAALRNNLQVIFCVGEDLEIRNNKQHLNKVFYQLKDSLFHLSKNDWKNIVIAYEPVWAIGTGETASPQQAQEMHQYIREQIKIKYDDTVSNQTSILYGGSVKPSNAKEIFSQLDVDGGLVGGASLDAKDFSEIIRAF